MMDVAVDIADAIVDELGGMPITAQRRALPEYELSELTATVVSVVPKSVSITNITRSIIGYEVKIDIGVQKKIGADIDSEVLTMSRLVSDIVLFLNRRELSSYPSAIFKSIENDPIYAADVLHERRVFISVITVTYRVLQ